MSLNLGVDISDLRKTSPPRAFPDPYGMSLNLGVDISEVYSPPRVAMIATERRGLSTGTSFDITTEDENGIPWDLSRPDVQERCRARVMKEKPGLLIGSPMCRDWSQIMNIN